MIPMTEVVYLLSKIFVLPASPYSFGSLALRTRSFAYTSMPSTRRVIRWGAGKVRNENKLLLTLTVLPLRRLCYIWNFHQIKSVGTHAA
jgi:hypothetical protein